MHFGEERERRTSALDIVSMSPPSYPSAWLHPCRARFCFTWQSHCSSSCSRHLLPALLPLLTCFLQLAVSCRVDLRLTAGQHVSGCNESNRAVQAHGVVVVHVLLYQPPRIFRRQRRARPDALALQRFVPALQLPVRLRVVGRRSHMRHARNTNELFEVPRNELRTVVGNDARLRFWIFLLGSLQNDLDLCLCHGLAQIPMHDGSAIAVQHAAQVVKRPRNVDVAHVDMPMLMRLRWLLEARPFLRRLSIPFLQKPCLPQYSPNARRTHCHHVGIQ